MISVALAAVLVVGLSASASAQERPRPAVELTGLREQAIEIVRNGDTTLEEITRVFHEL